jgi:hypothetical protein
MKERCSQCAGAVRIVELENCFELECEADPLHYSEIKRKPGADHLWPDVSLPEVPDNQMSMLFS